MSQTYPIDLYSVKSSKPASSTDRLAVINFKKTDKRPVPPASHCVSIPAIKLTCEPVELSTLLQQRFEEMQDAIIRDVIEEFLNSIPSNKSALGHVITDDQISPSAVAAYATEGIGKASQAKLNAWFDLCLQEPLGLALAKVMQIADLETASPDVLTRWSAAIDQHKSLLSSLAAPASKLPVPISEQLLRAIALAHTTDRVQANTTEFLSRKLNSFLKPATALELSINL